LVPLADEIFRTGLVTSVDGRESIGVGAGTPREICEYLKQLVIETRAKMTLEVGLAFGLATLSICEGLQETGGEGHVAIDANQAAQWQNIGIENVKRAGFEELVELREKPSHVALPELAAEGLRVDFAFIDGWNTFDHALVDFFYVDKMLNAGGVVAVDDCFIAGVHAVCRYIATNRAYRVRGVCECGVALPESLLARLLKKAARRSAVIQRAVKSKFYQPDERLGFTPFTRCIAFEKIAEDERSWDAHAEF
jgi:predicted O-methyltransferase YrrM